MCQKQKWQDLFPNRLRCVPRSAATAEEISVDGPPMKIPDANARKENIWSTGRAVFTKKNARSTSVAFASLSTARNNGTQNADTSRNGTITYQIANSRFENKNPKRDFFSREFEFPIKRNPDRSTMDLLWSLSESHPATMPPNICPKSRVKKLWDKNSKRLKNPIYFCIFDCPNNELGMSIVFVQHNIACVLLKTKKSNFLLLIAVLNIQTVNLKRRFFCRKKFLQKIKYKSAYHKNWRRNQHFSSQIQRIFLRRTEAKTGGRSWQTSRICGAVRIERGSWLQSRMQY